MQQAGEVAVPVLKVGAVVLRADSSAVLIIRPKPKHAGEVPHFVLPRGSRQYSIMKDGATEWHDARDVATGIAHAATLEPFTRALAREVEEEAGVTPEQLAAAQVRDMGAMDFSSRSKGVYPIHWFVVVVDARVADTLAQQMPVDATAVKWATLGEIEVMAAAGEFSAGYVPVIKAAYALQTKP